jgi:hypothetical protein
MVGRGGLRYSGGRGLGDALFDPGVECGVCGGSIGCENDPLAHGLGREIENGVRLGDCLVVAVLADPDHQFICGDSTAVSR